MEIYGDLEHENALNFLQKWFEDNKKLPNKIDRIYLTRFYYRASRDVEATQKLLELHYSIRSKSPNIYVERDPESEDIVSAAAYLDILNLPGLTPDNYSIELSRLKNPDPKAMNLIEDIRYYIMINDSRFCRPDMVKNGIPLLARGVIQIVDMEVFSLKLFTRLSVATIKSIMKYCQSAYPAEIKAMHFLNCPSYLNKILAFSKPFLSKEMNEKMHFHTTGLDTVFDHIPRELLPNEYGGKAGKLSVLSDQALASIREKRDYLMDPNYWRVEKL